MPACLYPPLPHPVMPRQGLVDVVLSTVVTVPPGHVMVVAGWGASLQLCAPVVRAATRMI